MAPNKLYASDTRVPVGQTRSEIEALMAKHGADQFLSGIFRAAGAA